MTRTKISCLFAKFNIDYCGRCLDHSSVRLNVKSVRSSILTVSIKRFIKSLIQQNK